MPASSQQGFAQPEAAPFQGQHEPPPFAAPQGYGETDAEFDEATAEEEEEPRRGRRGLMIVAALVGAIGLGGGMAYAYKVALPGAHGTGRGHQGHAGAGQVQARGRRRQGFPAH